MPTDPLPWQPVTRGCAERTGPARSWALRPSCRSSGLFSPSERPYAHTAHAAPAYVNETKLRDYLSPQMISGVQRAIRPPRLAAHTTHSRSVKATRCGPKGWNQAEEIWRSSADVCAALGDPSYRVEENVDLLERVVERKRGTDRGFQSQATQDRLRAVMAGAHRDAFGVERLAHLKRVVSGQHERQHAGLFGCGAHQADTRDVGQPRSRVVQQRALVRGDALQAQPLDVPQRLSEADGVGDVAGAGLELAGRPLIQRAFQRHVGDHVAAALPRRC